MSACCIFLVYGKIVLLLHELLAKLMLGFYLFSYLQLPYHTSLVIILCFSYELVMFVLPLYLCDYKII